MILDGVCYPAVLFGRVILYVWYVYVCMYDHTYSKSMDQPGKVANPARSQLNRENEYFPVRVLRA